MRPGAEELWFLPLGGTGEIGMNLNLYGHAGHWLMVDCGVTFAKEGEPGPHVQMADPSFIARRRDELAGLLVTHAHEDHVGAVAHLWPRLRCPVFTTRFTAAVLERKLAEHGLVDRVPVTVVETGARHGVGPFDVEWVSITHSIPEARALVLRTDAGTVFHTGDWKLDPQPVLGRPYDEARFRALGEEGVDAMVCDSTNALEPGHSVSEAALHAGLRRVVEAAEGRVVVTSFGSNVARLHTLARVATETGRYVAILGRSLRNMVAAARAAGLWHPEAELVDSRDLGYLPRHEILMVATGSQGDPHAAMDRLSRGTHPDLDLEAGDTAVFSSRVIPGNERALEALEARLARLGVHVVTADDAPIHASGHPCEEELVAMYRWIAPAVAIPTHGTPRHLARHADVARDAGVRRRLTGENGDLFMIAPNAGVRRSVAEVGRLGVGERGLESLAVPTPEDRAAAR